MYDFPDNKRDFVYAIIFLLALSLVASTAAWYFGEEVKIGCNFEGGYCPP